MCKKALIVGINNYENNQLRFCVSDAIAVSNLLEFNEDGSRNFSIKLMINEEATKNKIINNIKKVFSDDTETGLFYFSGHGFDDEYDGKIVTYDYKLVDYGIPFNELLAVINKSKCRNKIIILDCCHSGKVGQNFFIGDCSVLPLGTTILTSCLDRESCIESREIGHGLFTNLFLDALSGGAADVLGRITPGSVYSFIDSSLENFEQRPVFKTNVTRFVSLRTIEPKISIKEIRKLHELFDNFDYKYKLDPSYEKTNYKDSKEIGAKDIKEPYCIEKNTKIFDLLQKAVSNGLVKPSTERHMFFAAMNSDTCELTSLGKHYWYMVEHKKI